MMSSSVLETEQKKIVKEISTIAVSYRLRQNAHRFFFGGVHGIVSPLFSLSFSLLLLAQLWSGDWFRSSGVEFPMLVHFLCDAQAHESLQMREFTEHPHTPDLHPFFSLQPQCVFERFDGFFAGFSFGSIIVSFSVIETDRC